MTHPEPPDGHFPDEDYYPVRQPTSVPKPERTVRLSVIARIVAAVVTVGIVSFLVWDRYIDPEPDTVELATQVQQSMQKKLSSDPDFKSYGIQVEEVTLFKDGESRYSGLAEVTTTKMKDPHSVPVDVKYDGENMMWQVEPGAFLFLAQESTG